MHYVKNIINGLLIGIVNPIPGVSGGTIMVLLGIYNDITLYMSNIFSKNKKSSYKEILFLGSILLGIVIGVIFFSKVIRYLYINFLPQTMSCFSGLILFSIPIVIRNELNNNKINLKYFLIGIIIIFLVLVFSKNNVTSVTTLPITLYLLIDMIFIGFISGSITIFPGISGSMVLLLLGKYYTYNHYLSEAITLNINVLIPLLFIFIGILFGTIISSKISTFLLKKYKNKTMSLIIGFLFMSGLIIIPYTYNYGLDTLISSLITFILGGLIINLFNKFKKK